MNGWRTSEEPEDGGRVLNVWMKMEASHSQKLWFGCDLAALCLFMSGDRFEGEVGQSFRVNPYRQHVEQMPKPSACSRTLLSRQKYHITWPTPSQPCLSPRTSSLLFPLLDLYFLRVSSFLFTPLFSIYFPLTSSHLVYFLYVAVFLINYNTVSTWKTSIAAAADRTYSTKSIENPESNILSEDLLSTRLPKQDIYRQNMWWIPFKKVICSCIENY